MHWWCLVTLLTRLLTVDYIRAEKKIFQERAGLMAVEAEHFS